MQRQLAPITYVADLDASLADSDDEVIQDLATKVAIGGPTIPPLKMLQSVLLTDTTLSAPPPPSLVAQLTGRLVL